MIAIFGGTFDPVHFGHLRMAVEAAEALSADQLRFLPCRTPVHRPPTCAGVHHRLAMLQLAIDGQDGFSIDLREVERQTPSYMVESLTTLRREHPDQSLVLLLGMDAFTALPGWHRWRDISRLAHLLVLQRPGSELVIPAELQALLNRCRVDSPANLAGTPAGRICFFPATALAISASAIRRMLAEGRSVRYLLPDAVLDYIQAHELY